MPRSKRITKGGIVYHVLNRANSRLRIFKKKADFAAFENILSQGIDRLNMRLCGYCIMGNHWHMIIWPRQDGDVSEFMQWVTVTHSVRWHTSHGTVGIGHLYQGRYKSFPIQSDKHYLTVMRYVEANPLRAGIVKSALDWPWSSLAQRLGQTKDIKLSKGPLDLPMNWKKLVAMAVDQEAKTQLENCIRRGRPFGSRQWITKTAVKLNLESTLRPRGRPRKKQQS